MTGDSSSAAPDSPIPESRRWLSLSVLAGALALDLSGLSVLNSALPKLGNAFDLENNVLQWTMTSYAVTFAGFLLLAGKAADVLGRRRMFGLGILLFTVAALGAAVAPNISVLIIARAVQGIGAALSGPAALALLTEIFPEGPARNHAFSIYAATGAASASGGIILGGVLTDYLGWRSVFVFSVAFGAVVLAGVRSALPPSVRQPQKIDLVGAAAVTLGLLLVVFGVSRAGQTGWSDASVLGSLVASAVLLAVFAVWELRTPEPLLTFGIFRLPSVRSAGLAAFAQYTASLGILFFAPLYLQDVLHYSPLRSGFAVLPLSLCVVVTSNFFTGRLLAKVGQRVLLVAGLVVIGLGIATWAWSPAENAHYWGQLLPGLAVMGVGIGFVFPAMTTASLTGVPQSQHGVAGAVNVAAQQIGGSVGVAALVVIAGTSATSSDKSTVSGYHTAYLVAAAVSVAAALVIAVTRDWGKESKPASTQEEKSELGGTHLDAADDVVR